MKLSLTPALAAANLLLLGLLGALWIGVEGFRWQPPAPLRPDFGIMAPPATTMSDADVSRYMLILDRPIFAPTRRPPPPPKAASATPDPFDSMQLLGTFSGADGAGVLLRVEGRSRRLRQNESVGEWTLKEVRPREAVFARGGETRSVALLVARSAAARSSLPPAVAAPVGVPPPVPPAPAAPAAPAPPAGAGAPAAGAAAPPGGASSGRPAAPAAEAPSPFVIGGSRR